MAFSSHLTNMVPGQMEPKQIKPKITQFKLHASPSHAQSSLAPSVKALQPHAKYNKSYKEGWLRKNTAPSGSTINHAKSWERRWFVLQDTSLSCFIPGEEDPHLSIPLNEVRAVVAGERVKVGDWTHSLKISVERGKSMVVVAENAQEALSWIEAIAAVRNYLFLYTFYEMSVSTNKFKFVTAVDQYRWDLLSDTKFISGTLLIIVGILKKAANTFKDSGKNQKFEESLSLYMSLQDTATFYLQTVYAHCERPFEPAPKTKLLAQTKDLIRRFQKFESSTILAASDQEAIKALLPPLKPKIYHIGQLIITTTLDLYDELNHLAETIRQILTQFNETPASEQWSSLAKRLTALSKEYCDDVFSTRDPVLANSGVQICKLIERSLVNKDMIARQPETREDLMNESRDISRRIEKVLHDCVQPEIVNPAKAKKPSSSSHSLSTRNLLTNSRLDVRS